MYLLSFQFTNLRFKTIFTFHLKVKLLKNLIFLWSFDIYCHHNVTPLPIFKLNLNLISGTFRFISLFHHHFSLNTYFTIISLLCTFYTSSKIISSPVNFCICFSCLSAVLLLIGFSPYFYSGSLHAYFKFDKLARSSTYSYHVYLILLLLVKVFYYCLIQLFSGLSTTSSQCTL